MPSQISSGAQPVAGFALTILCCGIALSSIRFFVDVMPLASVGQFMCCLIWAYLFARLINSGFMVRDHRLDQEDNAAVSDAFGRMLAMLLVRQAFALLVLVGVFSLVTIPMFSHSPFAIFSLIILSMLFSLMHLAASIRAGAGNRLVSPEFVAAAYFLFLGAFTYLVIEYGDLDASVALALGLLSAVLLIPLLMFKLSRNLGNCPRSPVADFIGGGAMETAGRLLQKNSDLFVVGWLLPPREVFYYLVMRLSLLPLSAVYALLAQLLSRPLDALFLQRDKQPFRAAAARGNLALLLISGACGLATLLLAPVVLAMVGATSPYTQTSYLWLVVGVAALPLLGLAEPLLTKVNVTPLTQQLPWLIALPFIMVMMVWGQGDLHQIAVLFAISQLVYGLACSFLVGRYLGVWPGITALFYGRLKLL